MTWIYGGQLLPTGMGKLKGIRLLFGLWKKRVWNMKGVSSIKYFFRKGIRFRLT